MNKSRGRPRGRPDTRTHIAQAARGLFLRHGYRATTLRAVAAEAGVDSALISYHFGSKKGLFGEVLQLHCAQSFALTTALDGDLSELPDRILRAVTDLWEDTEFQQLSLQDDSVMTVLQEYLEHEVLGRLAEFLGGQDATERAVAAVTVIGGLIFTRYLNPLPSTARLSVADVHRILGPPLRAALQSRTRHASGRRSPAAPALPGAGFARR
ncbi:TetR/AcrR family transcriptional regulator [Streptomyces sp. NBC_00344]|uniref:TetR/AcrR family transcriptional regulator n=1 Tax=Streptomyces sp. NBC_00344 TaxID=2975720 RepID=UPI002E21DCF4